MNSFVIDVLIVCVVVHLSHYTIELSSSIAARTPEDVAQLLVVGSFLVRVTSTCRHRRDTPGHLVQVSDN